MQKVRGMNNERTYPSRPLTTEEVAAGFQPAFEVEGYNAARYDFEWSDDFAAFRPVRLAWWDDRSYAAYQADCGDYDERDDGEVRREHEAEAANDDTRTAEERAVQQAVVDAGRGPFTGFVTDDDNIPF